MAVVVPVITYLGGSNSVAKFTYTNMANGDTGSPIPWTQWADRSVQVAGTFGAGGNLRWRGSNDGGATYATLTDPQGNALDFTAAKIEQVMEVTEMAQPAVTAGDVTTSLTVNVIARRIDIAPL